MEGVCPLAVCFACASCQRGRIEELVVLVLVLVIGLMMLMLAMMVMVTIWWHHRA